jgi:DNA-binding PadR family transcriptional regulator
MYELFILSLLMRFPAHGYLLAHILNDMIGPYAKISNGRLYPLLTKLEESGLIEASEEADPEQRGERNSRGYQITEAGRKRFHVLMLDTTSNPGEYQRIFTHKVSVFYLLRPVERLYLIDHYIHYCQTHVLHLTNEAKDLAERPRRNYQGEHISMAATLGVMKHIEEQWQREVEWALCLRQEELTRQQECRVQKEQIRNSSLQQKCNQNQNQNQNQNHNRH